jgi:two-component SAPR family response regulator
VYFKNKYLLWLLVASILSFSPKADAREFTETSFLIAEINASNLNNHQLWDFIHSNNQIGIEAGLSINNNGVIIRGTNQKFDIILDQIYSMATNDSAKLIPVFLHYDGDSQVLDSIIQQSAVADYIFHLPRGEAWPSLEYLIQANRRVLFFASGEIENQSRILHNTKNYALEISAGNFIGASSYNINNHEINHELFMVDEFQELPTQTPPSSQSRNLVPDYINFLLENWTKFGKRPNFIFVGEDIFNFDFIISQLESFVWVNGMVQVAGKIMDKVYWRSPDVAVTGGRFSFPFRGGEEISISPFAPGYEMSPQNIIVTSEMEIPENYTITATPLQLGDGLVSGFRFDGLIRDTINPEVTFIGENFTFSQDIERGTVLKLPENASVNLGPPENYGLRNSSFTVGCYVKFNEILDYGDNAIMGNYESEYRRGLHLILRSGNPYFGLWANDFIADVKLKPNIWYHLAWRYIIETGEQAIFLNGRNIGSSTGHPPFSGTGDIHLGSALSQGASLRGYIDNLYFWDRPLGSEEINRLALDELILIQNENSQSKFLQSNLQFIILLFAGLFLTVLIFLLIYRKTRTQKHHSSILLPDKNDANQINLFGSFKAIDMAGNDITRLFTSKIKELFLFVLFGTLKNQNGASVSDINEQLWPGLPTKKVTNNRAVTLNKLRKILAQLNGAEIISSNGFLTLKMTELFFCDYEKAFKLCQTTGGMDKQQLETFFGLVKKGRFLKGTNWPWLDEVRGFTGNQVIDNLLKLAAVYKKENKPEQIDAIARRILEYDELNEEATYLQIWTFQQNKNSNLANFHFQSFCTKYHETLGEKYPMDYQQFIRHFQNQLTQN